ncbi:sensor histidine kinase [Verminephrobacter aporrectodeae subsp. tuberculatae]|uniref:sensor histidine kinase n=1 Tax=Verminephrobacter aporrectodeae TaxID=1110389 RepID=UPI0022434E5F|nr:histidine kinase [Verminephrobacter aporrectodeae]MCW8163921.1 sensor histidine kinase [Verminephrobacter aporrectodeae subsp. tuberculatae]MCW8168155.1 sensor histidine kinase [Verminephrobacter aporrectodeae subsp. tuberculatae]
MQSSQILSTPPPDSTPPGAGLRGAWPAGRPVLVFDACQLGVVLRAVLFVELVVGVGALFESRSLGEWSMTLALLTSGTLPATLVWLITACSLKTVLQRLRTAQQYVAGVLLGALAGVYACAMLALVGMTDAPPWSASAAAGSLLAALLVTALVLRARGRTPAATTARLVELQSRIRPHFLFNTLNSAIALVRQEPARAEALLEDLSDLFRHALVEQGESITLAEEITLARHYLAIEAVRFGARLQVQWQLDPRADGTRLPPLLLQPLVENAVKHGIEPDPRGGRLCVRTELRGDRVVVRISNTLPSGEERNGAREGRAGHGIALANVRARLALLHDVQGGFSASVRDGLYQVRITLPAADPPRTRQRPAPGRGISPRGAAATAEPAPIDHEHSYR